MSPLDLVPKLAMVPEPQASRGFIFRAVIDPRCSRCGYYSVCSKNLRQGWRYKVLSVRRVAHVCPILGEKMYVVEIEEAPLRVVVDSKVAVAGLKLRYKRVACDERKCTIRSYCAQAPLLDGENVRVAGVLNRVECLRGFHLALVELVPAE
ncbi:MAG: UPF0179 family protein [Thermofilaceae archaeon]